MNYPSIQYSWCCRTKQTGGGSASGGLDKCSDVMSEDKLSRMPPAHDPVEYDDEGGFHLLDLIITELKNHMTCYNSMPLIG